MKTPLNADSELRDKYFVIDVSGEMSMELLLILNHLRVKEFVLKEMNIRIVLLVNDKGTCDLLSKFNHDLG